MFPAIIIITITFSLLSTTLILFIVLKKQRAIQKERLGDEFKPTGIFQSGSKGEGTYQGVEYKYIYSQGGKNSPPSFRILIDCPSSGSFRLTKESGFDRFFKKLGICCEINTGDKSFDDTFYITTNEVDFTRAFFSSSNKRRAISEMYEIGFNHVSHDGKFMVVQSSPFNLSKKLNNTLLLEIVSHLITLAKGIPTVAKPRTFGVPSWKIQRIVAFTVTGLIELLGIFALVFGLIYFKPLDTWPLVINSFKISIPILAIFTWMAILLIRGRSSSHRELIIIIGMAIIAFPIAGAGFGIYLNGWLDKTDASSHIAQVVEKFESTSDNSTTYYAMVRSWRQEGSTEKLRITSWDYTKIIPSESKIKVFTKPGKFDYEWIVNYKIDL